MPTPPPTREFLFLDAFEGMAIEIDPIKIKTAIVINKYSNVSLLKCHR